MSRPWTSFVSDRAGRGSILSDARLRGRRGGRRRGRRRGHDDDGLHEGRGVEILGIQEGHLSDGLEDGGGDHLAGEARGREDHLVALRDDRHRCDERRQPRERRVLADYVSDAFAGRNVLHDIRASFPRRRLEGHACAAQGQTCRKSQRLQFIL